MRVIENKCSLNFEADLETTDIKALDSYFGYLRVYFRNGSWHSAWMEANRDINESITHDIEEIINWLNETFSNGCNWEMDEYFKENYPNFMDDERYLIKPNFSNHYKVMVNTRYGNSEYPIKIYVYE